MPVRLQSLTPMLQTADMAKTIAWYTSVLDFRCVAREGSWSRLERDDVSLMFMKNDHLGAPHATATQYIHVSDVAALWIRSKTASPPNGGRKKWLMGCLNSPSRTQTAIC